MPEARASFADSTRKFAMDIRLADRLAAIRDMKQADVGSVRRVTLNEALKDVLDFYDTHEGDFS